RVGLYINNLPLHSRIAGGQTVAGWLQELQRRHTEARQYQYDSLNDIQGWTDIRGELFDTVMVFDNYAKAEYDAQDHVLKARQVSLEKDRNYLLSLAVHIAEELVIDFTYNGDLLGDRYVEMIKD